MKFLTVFSLFLFNYITQESESLLAFQSTSKKESGIQRSWERWNWNIGKNLPTRKTKPKIVIKPPPTTAKTRRPPIVRTFPPVKTLAPRLPKIPRFPDIPKKPKIPTKPKESEKTYKLNTRPNYIPSDILEKLRRVKSTEDFIREFNPRGVAKKIRRIKPGRPDFSSKFGVSSAGGGFPGVSQPDVSAEAFAYEVTMDSSGPQGMSGSAGVAGNDRTSSDSSSSSGTGTVAGLPPVTCIPRDKVTEVPQPADLSAVRWPTCTYTKQCGGCCVNPKFQECVPNTVKKVNMMVFNVPVDRKIRPYPSFIEMIHHSSCKCQCRVKSTDCYPTQTYDAPNCQCTCQRTPTNCSPGKQWSERACGCVCATRLSCNGRQSEWSNEECRCVCPTEPACPLGSFRDPNTCICVSVVGDRQVSFASQKVASDAGGSPQFSLTNSKSSNPQKDNSLDDARWNIYEGYDG